MISTLVAAITLGNSGGHQLCLQVIPVRTGLLTKEEGQSMRYVKLHNHDIAVCAASLVTYSIAICGFNTCHFIDNNASLPIQVALAADVRPSGCAMFKKFTNFPQISDSANSLLQSIACSKAISIIHCYCIHSHRFLKRETKRTFWSVQAAIVKQLRESRSLTTLWVFIHTSCDTNLVSSFKRSL